MGNDIDLFAGYTKSFKRKVDAEEFAAAQAVDFRRGELRDKPEEMTLDEY